MKKIRTYRKILIIFILFITLIGGGLSLEKLERDHKNSQVSIASLSEEMLIPGGMPIGIYMETDGVLIIGTEGISNRMGEVCEPAKYIVKEGDYIIALNHIVIESKAELIKAVKELETEEVVLALRRDEKVLEVRFDCVEVGVNEYKLGIWVRDNVQGLGTLTYLTTGSEFGALGHGIHDVDTNELLEIAEGDLYKTTIRGVQKGKAGSPGGLEGVIIYNNHNVIGTIEANTENGVYGTLDNIDALFDNQEAVKICEKEKVKVGPATIRCCVDGKVKEYDIAILRVDLYSRSENKRIVLQVTDKELLDKTGGIVQGMSGSPILQNGKIVGAVTHVFVNDPTSGYGIFIEDMLK